MMDSSERTQDKVTVVTTMTIVTRLRYRKEQNPQDCIEALLRKVRDTRVLN